jgi:GTP-binding protein HflX
MQELLELARTAGVRVVDTAIQFREALDGRTLVGKGKLEEICLTALHKGAEMIIFDRDLGPSQLHAITDATDLKVLDRTMLILDIFARRAKSKGGQLQVELAQLKYSLPRLKERQTGMSRLTGGIGGQGPGETKLEIDRRRAKERITRLERELSKFSGERALRRRVRNEKHIPVVALVGYTNAGKSSLLNALTGAEVYTADELFATLDPTSRRLRFPEEREVVLIDTVGFIRDLPETLLHAFSATLEELHDADLLLHIVDGHDVRRQQQIEAVKTVLAELQLLGTPRILVLNKSDLIDAEKGEGERRRLDAVRTSAATRRGFDELIGRMKTALFSEGHDWPTPGLGHPESVVRR